MNLPTTILVLYPLIVLFMQAPPAGEAGNADASTDVWILPAATQSVPCLPPRPDRRNDAAFPPELPQNPGPLAGEAPEAETEWLQAASLEPSGARPPVIIVQTRTGPV